MILPMIDIYDFSNLGKSLGQEKKYVWLGLPDRPKLFYPNIPDSTFFITDRHIIVNICKF